MSVFQDLRYALRSLRAHPGFTAAAVATLTLGIGVNTTIFSIVNAVLLRSLPYRDADSLVLLWTTDPQARQLERPSGFLTVKDWQQQTTTLEELTVFRSEPVVWAKEPDPESLEACFVAPGFFTQLGVWPAVGRTFTSAEAERGERLVILSHALWQRHFNGSPDAIGKTMRIDGKPAQVIGVLPDGFRPLSSGTQLWMPYSAVAYFQETSISRSGKFGWDVLARLRPGVRIENAQTEMNGIVSRLAQAYPADYRGGVRVVSLHEQVTGPVRLPMQLLFAAVIAVLLIACTNLGNLVLARGAGRAREISVRAALGAGRGRLISQFLTESLTLSLLAGVLGLLFAETGLQAVLTFAPKSIPRLNEVTLDSRAVLFTLAVSIVSAILFGLAPAFRMASTGLATGTRIAGGGRPARRMRDLLVVAEFALAMILLAGAGLLVRSMIAVVGVDPGYRASGVLTVALHPVGIADDAARFAQLAERLEALPGIQAVGGISRYFQANLQRAPVTVEGHPPAPPSQWDDINYDVIAGHYLQALGVPLLRGRYFGPQDGPDSPKVVMVNDAFVRKFLPDEDPVGKRFRRGGDPTWYTIVGVMGDMRRQTLSKAPIAEALWPHSQRSWGMGLVVRTAGDPLALAPTVREAIHAQDPTAVITGITTLDRQLDDQIAQRRFQTRLLGLFAALALVLAAIGIYGLMHYAVTERTQELGIRVALGALPRDVFGLVLGHAARLALIGITLGVIGALWVTRALSTLLYSVSAHDPVTYTGVAILLAGIAAAASAMPAWLATRADPLTALRHE
jgi:predicted permease